MNVLGLFEVDGTAAARRRRIELAALREEVVAARAREAERSRASALVPAGPAGPPVVAHELITIADRLVDLTCGGAPPDPVEAAAALRWLTGRVNALMAMCEVAPIADDGALDYMRHEVVADRPAPSTALVDHIADTVRPGYRWRHDLLRAQQVVAYVAPD